MKSELKRRIKIWSIAMLVCAAVVSVFLLPADSDAARTLPPPRAVVVLDTNSPLVQTAARVFSGQNCIGCHYLTDIWGKDGWSLDGAAEKYELDALRRYIRDPKSVNAEAIMPPQETPSDVSLETMARFLAGLPRAGTNTCSHHEPH
jgi:hypothetical protein